jgi:hypothetical protein
LNVLAAAAERKAVLAGDRAIGVVNYRGSALDARSAAGEPSWHSARFARTSVTPREMGCPRDTRDAETQKHRDIETVGKLHEKSAIETRPATGAAHDGESSLAISHPAVDAHVRDAPTRLRIKRNGHFRT